MLTGLDPERQRPHQSADERPNTESKTGELRSNAAEFTVSEISNALKRTVEDAFGNVRVRGEISGYRGPHSSGHAYFSLKDDKAKIDAVVWRTTMQRLKFRPEEGMEVIATGRLTTYPGKSSYQIVIDNLEPAGAGALMALLEERKKRLAAEGLFDKARKRPLPYMPAVIGVVTSPTGAVIRDIIHRIKDRFPLQDRGVAGARAGRDVRRGSGGGGVRLQHAGGGRPGAEARRDHRGARRRQPGGPLGFQRRGAGAGRGRVRHTGDLGGRPRDRLDADRLSSSDMRAPTPTGAAEFAVPVKAELEATLASLAARLKACTSRNFERKRTALRAAARALPSPDQLLALPRRRFDEATSRLGRALTVSTERKRARLDAARLTPAMLSRRIGEAKKTAARDLQRAQAALRALVRERRGKFDRAKSRLSVEPVARRQKLARDRLTEFGRRGEQAISLLLERNRTRLDHSERLLATLKLSDQSILDRGYALVIGPDGKLIKRAAEVSLGAELTLKFADGTAKATGGGLRLRSTRSAASRRTRAARDRCFRRNRAFRPLTFAPHNSRTL